MRNGDIGEVLGGAENGGFETGKRKIKTVNFGVREGVFVAVAMFGDLADLRAAWVGEAKDFGDFVETFTDGVISGGADDVEMVMFCHINELSVATGNNGCEERKGGGAGRGGNVCLGGGGVF